MEQGFSHTVPGNYGWSLLVYKYLEEDAITAMHKLHKVLQNWNEYYRERNLPPHYALVISTDAGGPKYYREVIDGWNEIARNSGMNIPEIEHSTALEFLQDVDVPESKSIPFMASGQTSGCIFMVPGIIRPLKPKEKQL